MLLRRSRISFANPFKRLSRRLQAWLPLFLLVFFLLLTNHFLLVRRVECLFNSSPCSPETLQKSQKYLGKNFLLINQKELTSSIQASLPTEKVSLGFKLFGTLRINIEGRLSPLPAQVLLVESLPSLSLDASSSSTASASFTQPTEEIDRFSQSVLFLNFEIWDTGQMTPSATATAKIKYLFTEKPDLETVKAVYHLISVVERYLEVDEFMILNHRVFLRQQGQPDIIVNIPFDEDSLVQALQSYAYLTTIKKDAKVIDLRFKNPTLR